MAGILERVPLGAPDARQALRLLGDATGAARYWQPPDGDDWVAALPELRGPLLHVADALLSSPSAEWWDSGCDRDSQWAQTFVEIGERPLFPARGADEVLSQWRESIAPAERDARAWYAEHPEERFSGSW